MSRSSATLQARAQILSEWKDDINKAITATHQKLNELGDGKVQQTTQAVQGIAGLEEEEEEKVEKDCTTISLDFETLMRDLDVLYQK